MPANGWHPLAPLGEFSHAHAGVIQVVDRTSWELMVRRFEDETRAPTFAGLLLDCDHMNENQTAYSGSNTSPYGVAWALPG